MRGSTHTLMGAAAALPVAVAMPPLVAAGCVWWGMVGGGFPDWLDLRSDARRALRLRHRGVSHSLFLVGGFTVAVSWVVHIVGESEMVRLPADAAAPWAIAFALGALSHLLGDACTIAGIQPWLPFSRRRFWLLPRLLRTRSDGFIDRVGRLIAMVGLVIGAVFYAAIWVT